MLMASSLTSASSSAMACSSSTAPSLRTSSIFCESFTSSVTTPCSTMNIFTSSTLLRFRSTAKEELSSRPPLPASAQAWRSVVTPPCAHTAHTLSEFSVSSRSACAARSLASAVAAPTPPAFSSTCTSGAITPAFTSMPLYESDPATTATAPAASSWTRGSRDSRKPASTATPSSTSSATTRTHASSSDMSSAMVASACARCTGPPILIREKRSLRKNRFSATPASAPGRTATMACDGDVAAPVEAISLSCRTCASSLALRPSMSLRRRSRPPPYVPSLHCEATSRMPLTVAEADCRN
uniref:Uncharacterized protein n=1 Tax=Triticum urartu TaxID=4572 RepID=A0A8R7V7A5_TRIUA